MKVALYVHCFFPNHFHGTETYTLGLAKSLRDLGHQPIVVSGVFQGETAKAELVTCYDYEGLSIYCIDKNHVPHASLQETYFQPRMREVHMDLLRALRPDIIHVTHLINHTAALLDAAKDLGIPAVATFTDFFGFCLNNKLQTASGGLCSGPNRERTNCFSCAAKAGINQTTARLSEETLTKAAPLITAACVAFNWARDLPGLRNTGLAAHLRAIKERPGALSERYKSYGSAIAPTHFLRTAYEANGLGRPAIREIPFGVDVDRGSKETPALDAPLRFGFIGQIAPHKGTGLLVEAFCSLPVNTTELHIYGDETQYPKYVETMKARARNHNVVFCGTFGSSEMRGVLDTMDVLVIPSIWYENSPLVLLYALATHTPVVVSDVAGLTEFVDPDRNGYVFERGSKKDLKRVLLELSSNPAECRRRRSTTCYERTTLSMTQEVIGVYQDVLRRVV